MSDKPSSFQVIVLAAGKGVRMKSRLPKVLHRVCGRTLLERVLRVCAEVEACRVVVVIGSGESLVREELERLQQLPRLSEMEIEAVVQSEQKGTAQAVQMAMPALRDTAEDVLILPGDVPLLDKETLLPFLSDCERERPALAFMTCNHPQPGGFGRVVRDSSGSVKAIVEAKDCREDQLGIREINTSIYLTSRDFLAKALESVDSENAQGEYYLTDIVGYAVGNSLSVQAMLTGDHMAVAGANTRYELSVLEMRRRSQINKLHMDEGVTFENPNAAYIDERVKIGRDCYIGAGTRLVGETVLDTGVVVEGDSLISDSFVGESSRIRFGSYIESSRVGPNCQIGPFAHLRQGTCLHEGVKIGNFVETKKAELLQGVKANHLTYIGDAWVERNVNIGAGTITCNFDGEKKHETVIGEGAFIGSNTCLVAPVRVSKGAYVGAGSTITKEVPANALAISRAPQATIENWAAKKRKKTAEE